MEHSFNENQRTIFIFCCRCADGCSLACTCRSRSTLSVGEWRKRRCCRCESVGRGAPCTQREPLVRRSGIVRSRRTDAWRACGRGALLEGLCGEQGRPDGECAEYMRRTAE